MCTRYGTVREGTGRYGDRVLEGPEETKRTRTVLHQSQYSTIVPPRQLAQQTVQASNTKPQKLALQAVASDYYTRTALNDNTV